MKYNNFDIIIGIPALNEQATIKNVVSVLDDGLKKYFSNKKSLIVLLDSNSTDDTVNIYNLINSHTPKLVIKNTKSGKGRNIINLLNFSIKNSAKCICMIDADIKNINEGWIFKLINPILSKDVDYVIPIYKRGKFSGNITNLICRPMLYGIYGLYIIQPIGGDFAFNKNYANSLLNAIKSAKNFIFESKPYSKEELSRKLELALSLIKKNKVKNKIYYELNMSELENKNQMTSKDFNSLLVKVAKLLKSKDIANKVDLFYIINLIRPYFYLRVYTYFKEIEDEKPREVEKKLIQSCRFIRNKILE